MAQQRLALALTIGSPGERALETRLAQLAPELAYEREYRFAPDRGYRFDFAWPAQRLAVEVDGGTWAYGGGRHNTDADRDKLNLAASLGWRVLRFSPAMIERNPDRCVAQIRAAFTYPIDDRPIADRGEREKGTQTATEGNNDEAIL